MPSVFIQYWGMRVMAYLAVIVVLVALWGLWLTRREKLASVRAFPAGRAAGWSCFRS